MLNGKTNASAANPRKTRSRKANSDALSGLSGGRASSGNTPRSAKTYGAATMT
jgi:hypothetical protein